MNDFDSRKLNFFDYLDLARQEFQNMLKKHPELYPNENLKFFPIFFPTKHRMKLRKSSSFHLLLSIFIAKTSTENLIFPAENRS